MINRSCKYYLIPIPEKVRLDQWAGVDDYWVNTKHSFYFEINTKIREEKLVIQNLIKRYYLAGKKITFPMIFGELKNTGSGNCFNIFFANYIKHPSDRIEICTSPLNGWTKLVNQFSHS